MHSWHTAPQPAQSAFTTDASDLCNIHSVSKTDHNQCSLHSQQTHQICVTYTQSVKLITTSAVCIHKEDHMLKIRLTAYPIDEGLPLTTESTGLLV